MDKAEAVKTITEELLQKMIGTFTVEVLPEEDVYQIIIKTENDAPTVIGRHGETIRALQKILEVMLYKQFGEPLSILVNVNDYREKQQERLEGLATQYATQVQNTKESTYIRGLSSYERKMIHEYVTTNYPDLTSYSVGEGRDRKLVVDLKGNEPKTEPEKTEEV
ncbi:MAG: R3H domain-containing nucleic acid-binding protein [bacterium]|nr:R3H domain-containing nucleic acid-binding protein [bacterium]